MGNFREQMCHQKHSEIAQSGNTGRPHPQFRHKNLLNFSVISQTF